MDEYIDNFGAVMMNFSLIHCSRKRLDLQVNVARLDRTGLATLQVLDVGVNKQLKDLYRRQYVCMYLLIGKGQSAQKRPYWGENRIKRKIYE